MNINSGEQWEKSRVEFFIYLNLPSDFLSLTLSLCCSLESGPSSDFPRKHAGMGDIGANHAFEFHSPGECSSKIPEPDGKPRTGREKVASLEKLIQIVP